MHTVVILNNDQMGTGDRCLGQKILGTFLRKAVSIESLHALVLYNAGVKLVVAGSPVLPELTQLHERGIEILPCGTCLDAYGLSGQVAVSRPSNMDEIVAALSKAAKVITL